MADMTPEELQAAFGDDQECVDAAKILVPAMLECSSEHISPIAVIQVMGYMISFIVSECISETEQGLRDGHTTRDLLDRLHENMLSAYDKALKRGSH